MSLRQLVSRKAQHPDTGEDDGKYCENTKESAEGGFRIIETGEVMVKEKIVERTVRHSSGIWFGKPCQGSGQVTGRQADRKILVMILGLQPEDQRADRFAKGARVKVPDHPDHPCRQTIAYTTPANNL